MLKLDSGKKKLLIYLGLWTLALIIASGVGYAFGSGMMFSAKSLVQWSAPSAEEMPPIKPVSHEAAYQFVLQDKTNENVYQQGYNCVDFALDLWRNANWNGIEAYLVGMDITFGRDHMVVAFPDEKGYLMLIDPINDAKLNPVVGISGFERIYFITWQRGEDLRYGY